MSSQNDDNLESIFKHKLSNCQRVCTTRKGKRGKMNLDLEYLHQLYILQKGLCYISNITLSLKVHSDFYMSIERIDETNGYVKGNVKLICLEFQNGHQQWSPEKFNDFCEQYDEFQCITVKDDAMIEKQCNEASVKNTKHTNKRKTPQKPYINSITKECLCRICDTIKSFTRFSTQGIKKGRCKECVHELNSNRNNTLRSKLLSLVSSSKQGIAKRNKSKWRQEIPLDHTLTFEELLDMYKKQVGRCAYSNQVLQLKGMYMMSLERINTKKGYTKKNCCLICIEFNSGDWSIVKCEEDQREGSSGWTKNKVKLVVDNFKQIKKLN